MQRGAVVIKGYSFGSVRLGDEKITEPHGIVAEDLIVETPIAAKHPRTKPVRCIYVYGTASRVELAQHAQNDSKTHTD